MLSQSKGLLKAYTRERRRKRGMTEWLLSKIGGYSENIVKEKSMTTLEGHAKWGKKKRTKKRSFT